MRRLVVRRFVMRDRALPAHRRRLDATRIRQARLGFARPEMWRWNHLADDGALLNRPGLAQHIVDLWPDINRRVVELRAGNDRRILEVMKRLHVSKILEVMEVLEVLEIAKILKIREIAKILEILEIAKILKVLEIRKAEIGKLLVDARRDHAALFLIAALGHPLKDFRGSDRRDRAFRALDPIGKAGGGKFVVVGLSR